jgi:hypothetical protein
MQEHQLNGQHPSGGKAKEAAHNLSLPNGHAAAVHPAAAAAPAEAAAAQASQACALHFIHPANM